MIALLQKLICRKDFDVTKSISNISAAIACPRDDDKVIIDLPIDMLVMHGASRYSGGWHPFVAALSEGPNVLEAYYRRVRPHSFEEFYYLGQDGELPPWALPWVITKPPTGEGLGLEHGISYYGPASAEKVRVEYERLLSVTASIRDNGFLRRHRIRGFFLKLDDSYRFFVRGGKHRTAALTFLGGDRIPAQFCSGWPRLIDHDDADNWPMVRNKLISKQVAQAGFRRYFEFNGTQHLGKKTCGV
ncbi:hypothetical protein [Taklimakanibacter lacteus]|uniref:hypothetical protein n=1 Tax=Taklimakanibacter lacteus TaxID=2268456 RepID=UPI000E66F5B3